jgi:O-antigen/teichoic acid export membrane protein
MADLVVQRTGAGLSRRRLTGSALLDSLLGKAGELTTQVLLILLLPRVLGPVDYGTFALALSIVTLGSTSLAVGGPTLMSRFVPAAAPAQRDAVARALLFRVGRWRVLGISAAAFAAALLVVLVPDHFPATLTGLIAIALVFDIAATLAFQIALGMGRTAMWSHRFGAQNALVVSSALVGHALAGGQGAVAGIGVASGVVLVWGWWAVGPRLRAARGDAALPQGALRFGTHYAFSNVFQMVIHRGAIVAVSLLAASSVQTGFAGLAVGVALAWIYVVSQVFAVHLPSLVEGTGDSAIGPQAEETVRDLAARVLMVVVPLSVLAVVAIEEVVPLAVGDRFSGAVGAIAVALAALPIAPLNAVGGQVAALRLHAGARLVTVASGAGAFLITAVLAVPPLKAEGGAAALLAGTATIALTSLVAIPGALSARLTIAGLAGSGAVLAAGALTGAF